MKALKICIFIIFLTLSVFPYSYTVDWTNVPISASQAGSGGAFALSKEWGNVGYNPSVLAVTPGSGITFSGGMLSFGRSLMELSGAFKIEKGISPFISLRYSSVGGFEEALQDGSKTGDTFSVSRFMFSGGFAYRFGRAPLTASFGFKYFLEDLYELSSSGYGIKVNLSVFVGKFSIGIGADDLVQVITYDSGREEETKPVFTVCSAYAVSDALQLSGVFIFDMSLKLNFRAGARYRVNEKFRLSIGTNNYNISTGFQYKVKDIILDYSLQIERAFSGINNFIGISYGF